VGKFAVAQVYRMGGHELRTSAYPIESIKELLGSVDFYMHVTVSRRNLSYIKEERSRGHLPLYRNMFRKTSIDFYLKKI
jgi:hypothetical protein